MGVLTEDLKKRILAIKFDRLVIHVDRTFITNFAKAVEDPNPLYYPCEGARSGPYGEQIVPPGMLHARNMMPEIFPELPADMPVKNKLDGGTDVEYYIPIRYGDTIFVDTRYIDVFEKPGATGPMIFTQYVTEWTNQHGEIVGKSTSVMIRR